VYKEAGGTTFCAGIAPMPFHVSARMKRSQSGADRRPGDGDAAAVMSCQAIQTVAAKLSYVIGARSSTLLR